MAGQDNASSDKIVLLEIDFGQKQTQWFNWTAGVWYVAFPGVYDLIDPAYLAGLVAEPYVLKVGTAFQDGVALSSVGSLASAITTANSWYFDSNQDRLYVHLSNGDEPALHTVTIGVTLGLSNRAVQYNGLPYDSRIMGTPSVGKSKDPLFFGRISIDRSTWQLNNLDGALDLIGENSSALFGGEARLYQGFDSDAYGSFTRIGTRTVENVRISRGVAEVELVDKRATLSRSVPVNLFTTDAYPNLDPGNALASIPLVYGVVTGIKVICTNQTAISPTNWTFKYADTAGAGHNILSLDAVYVKGVLKSTTASDLTQGTFSLAFANYNPGDAVTADVHGFQNGGNLIKSPVDIITDLLATWLALPYNSTYYDTTEVAATKAAVDAVFTGGIGIVIDTPQDLDSVVQSVCNSVLLNLVPKDDGRYTMRFYDSSRATAHTFTTDELLDVPEYEYDVSQTITSTRVWYGQAWATGIYARLYDTSQEAALLATFKRYAPKQFETLLTTSADAQQFSTRMLALQGQAMRTFRVSLKMSALSLELMDFVQIPLWRPTKAMIGTVVAEVVGKTINAGSGVDLDCRIVRNV